MKRRSLQKMMTAALLLWTALCPQRSHAATENGDAWTLTRYLQRVAQSNLELLSHRLNVPIADAQIAVARLFPDPQLTGGVSQVDVSGQGAPLMSTLGLMLPLEMGGKRGSRIAVASSEAQVARSELRDYLRNLRGSAANAYIDAVYSRLVRERKQRTLASLERLVAINEQRLRVGDIGEVTLAQSRVEAQRFHGDVLSAQAEVRAADLKVAQLLGQERPNETLDIAERLRGELRQPERLFDETKLVENARSERPDVNAQRQSQESARARVRLARANRVPDLSVNVSWQRSLASDPFASPAYDALTATLTLPIPFSRVFTGELDTARRGQERASFDLAGAELRAEVEVRTALVRYRAAAAQVKLYTQGVLADADRVLAATLYTYQRGSATLLEVLNAQRTVDDIYLAYYQALADHARQLIAVEQAAGLWDITLE